MRKIKGTFLQDYIAQSGLSLHAWSIKHGFTQPTVYSWVTGQKGISERNVLKLEQIMGVDRNTFSRIVWRVRPDRIAEFQRRDDELLGHFHCLTEVQQERVLRMVQGLADANRAEEELKHGIVENAQ